ncbi:MAG: TSUP family transporter [Dehalococcoidia bacterium]|nr:TSUP family transporter [Dehalococcoidia bacterium]
MTPLEAVGLAFAAFLAGGINAIAGGGTLIGFPVLLAAGYGAKVANMTNTVAIWPGTISGSWAYRSEISRQRATITAIVIPVVAGAIAGSALLLSTPESTFEWIVPFLIYGACILLAFQDKLTKMFFAGTDNNLLAGRNLLLMRIGVFFVAVYGGYFGAAMGIIMLALFGLLLSEDMQHANALKGLVAMAVNGIAVVYFAIFGEVAWEAAAIMAVAALAGGYMGVGVARKLPKEKLRLVAVTWGAFAATVLLIRQVW